MKTCTVRLIGGVGNQLHCYAFGLAIAEQNGAVLEVDCDSGYWNDPYGRCFLLDRFPRVRCNKKVTPRDKPSRFFFKLMIKIGGLVSRALPLRLKLVVEEDRSDTRYQEDVHRAKYKSNPYFMGYWASYRYYEDIADRLRRDLRPPQPSNLAVLRMLKEIQSAKSCSIHWRSYAEEVGVKHPSLTEYYRKAFEVIEQLHPDIRFFVFSDNHSLARHLLGGLRQNLVFVELKEAEGDLQSLNDFYLMYACDHAIIGDSTFSWWSAWLSDTGPKKVVAPRGLSPWGDDWLPPHWIGIEIE